MIPLLVFYIHIVALTYVFSKRYQEEGLGEGFLGVFFMALIFFIGWSISSFLMKLVMSQQGLGRGFDRDAASLLFLTLCEGVFYRYFLRDSPPRQDGESPSF